MSLNTTTDRFWPALGRHFHEWGAADRDDPGGQFGYRAPHRAGSVAVLRAEPGVYGCVASDPTVSRAITALAVAAPAVLAAIDTARASARAQVWAVAGRHAPDHDMSAAASVVIDLDATRVTAHSEKEAAVSTLKRGFGFHPVSSPVVVRVRRPRC